MSVRNIEWGAVPLRRGSGAVTPREALRLVMDKARVVLLITAILVAFSALYAFLAQPIYSANALLRVSPPNTNELGIGNRQKQMTLPENPDTATEIQLVTSREILLPAIKQFHLDIHVAAQRLPVIGRIAEKFAKPGQPAAPWFGLDNYAWGGEAVSIGQLHVPPELQNKPLQMRVLPGQRFSLYDPAGTLLVTGEAGAPAQGAGVSVLVNRLTARAGTQFTVTRYDDITAVNLMLRHLQVVEQGKNTGVVKVSYENSDPTLAMQVTNAVVRGFLAANAASHQEEANKMLTFVQGELPRLRTELDDAERKLSQYRTHAGTMEPDRESQSYLRGGIDFDRQIAALKLQRTQLLSRFTTNSPEVRNIDQQLAELEGYKHSFTARFDNLPASQRRLAELTRNEKVASEIYVAMVNRAQELSVTRASNFGNVRIVDTALVPQKPVRPRRALIVAVATLLGLLLGALYVLLRRQLSSRVDDPLLVEQRLRLPVFGTIAFSHQQNRLAGAAQGQLLAAHDERPGDLEPRLCPALAFTPAAQASARSRALEPADLGGGEEIRAPRGVMAVNRPHDVTVEALRGVRTALQSGAASATNNILVVSAPTPETGKSFVAANLAVLEAETGKRVLLIDGDMRRGRLATHFGHPDAPGLSELLMGRAETGQVIQSAGVGGMSFLAAGRTPGHPAELLSTRHMEALLKMFSERFDLVVIDTPPVLAVADASILARHAGTTVLVLRPNAQTEREIEDSVIWLGRAGARVAGTIFNAMPPRRGEKRSYVYAYASAPDSAGY